MKVRKVIAILRTNCTVPDLTPDEERIGAKRKKKVQHFSNFFSDGGAGFGGGAGGGGGGGGMHNFFSKSKP